MASGVSHFIGGLEHANKQPKTKQPYPEQSPEHRPLSRLQNRNIELIFKLKKIMTKNCMF